MGRFGRVWGLLFIVAGGASALTPDEILLVANSQCADGVDVARQYCSKRHVPDSNIVLLSLSGSESFSRDAYEGELAKPLREFFDGHPDLKSRIRCLVTVYGVPTTVGRYTPTPEEQRLLANLGERVKDRLSVLREQWGHLCDLARTVDVPVPSVLSGSVGKPAVVDGSSVGALSNEIAQAHALLRALGKKIRTLPAYRHGEQRASQFVEIATRLVGGKRAEELAESPEKYPSGGNGPGEYAKARIGSEDREKLYAEREKEEGLLGVTQQLLTDMAVVQEYESEASVDSELSLLFWGDYDLYRWLPNMLNPVFGSKVKAPLPPPTLMVARLDGPTPRVAAELVDRAIAGESTEHEGVFYVDASAAQRASGGLYRQYDESLERTAQKVQETTTIEVAFDRGEGLFAPGACPRALLYCGWYSPKKYIDSFTWAPGAVGYHISSFGGQGLHRQDSEDWCKRMLETGIAATVGPVNEPYLQAFPAPDEFFLRLLSGQMSLVECYYATNPFNSWRMMLIGDPLYNPFRDHSVVRKEASGGAQAAGPRG